MAEEVRYEEFRLMLKELSLANSYADLLVENGFDEWLSITELTEEVLASIGVNNHTDRRQILACMEAAAAIEFEENFEGSEHQESQTKIKSFQEQMTSKDFKYSQSIPVNEGNSLNFHLKSRNPNIKESIEIIDSDDRAVAMGGQYISEDFFQEDKQSEIRGESECVDTIRTIPLSIAKIQKYSFKKINKGESEKQFFRRILHLYVKQAALNKIVIENYQGKPRKLSSIKGSRFK